MTVIGELFDQKMAKQLTGELLERGISTEINTVATPRGTVYQLRTSDEERASEAADYFRVRMGLPGAPQPPDPEWEKVRGLRMGFVSKTVLLISVAIYLTSFNPETFNKVLSWLFINEPGRPAFASLAEGEIWRLITPIFLHFNLIHIFFNGMWIKDLGPIMEREKGPVSFLFFIFVSAVTSNILQYLAMGPRFGGLSGVVYGLLGFCWTFGKLRLDDSGFRLPKNVVVLMVGWYFLCLTGLIGPIANIAHGVGLGVGMLWGLFPWYQGQLKERLKFIALAIFFSLGTYLIEIIRHKISFS